SQPMGSAPRRRQMVRKSDLAFLLPPFSAHPAATPESDRDVEFLDGSKRSRRARLRSRRFLRLRLARPLVSRMVIFLFRRSPSRRRALDPGALQARSGPGDLQLLRADQPGGAQRWLP